MKKYPVISNEGNKYLVTINDYSSERLVSVYRKRKYLWNKKLFSRNYYLSETNYVALAKDVVRLYEKELKELEYERLELDKSKKEFLNWDGKC